MLLQSLTDKEVLIRQELAAERFSEAEQLLREYAGAVVENCVQAKDESLYGRARDFVRSSLEVVRSQRAHYEGQLASLRGARAYRSTDGAERTRLELLG